MVDPFAANNPLFRLTSLTASMENLPYQPRRLEQLGWFTEAGLSTTTAWIEERDGVLYVFDVKARGSDGNVAGEGDRRGIEFQIPHIPAQGSLLADSVQGVRAFGTENQSEVLITRLNERLGVIRNSMDYTIEYHRMLAIKGQYMDANNVAQSLFTKFAVAQQTANFILNPSTDTEGQAQVVDLMIKIGAGLKGRTFSGVHVLCGTTFWQHLLKDKGRKQTYLNTPDAAKLRGPGGIMMDLWGCTWEWYQGDSLINIGATDAYMVPTGVQNKYLTRYAPAPYTETVNTIGRPYYVKSELMKFGKGWDFEAQSNPLNIDTVPRATIKLSYAAS
jgi:hypothetical protein